MSGWQQCGQTFGQKAAQDLALKGVWFWEREETDEEGGERRDEGRGEGAEGGGEGGARGRRAEGGGSGHLDLKNHETRKSLARHTPHCKYKKALTVTDNDCDGNVHRSVQTCKAHVLGIATDT